MNVEENKALINLMIDEIQNKQNLDLCDEVFAEDFINHTPPANITNDRAGMRQLFSMTHKAFPDGHIVVNDQISDGIKVWSRKTFTGTHTDDFASVPASGKIISYEVMDILVVENGKMTEHWSVLDRLDLFRQLGVIQA